MSLFGKSESFPERISRLADELYKTRRTLTHTKAELNRERDLHMRTIAERDALKSRLDESRSDELTFCPGTGRVDHAQHSILCYRQGV